MSSPLPRRSSREASAARIVCVGDIHGQWSESDEQALRALKPDLALFVGDYGDEDVGVTGRIAEFANNASFEVATVFGNHDAFYTAYSRKRPRPGGAQGGATDGGEGAVREQMEMLSAYDVSYRSVGFEKLGLCVCGGRSFSFGGPNWKHNQFYRRFLGVGGLSESSQKLREAVNSSEFKTVIFLSHSGPLGLGARPADPCGKDWGDHPGGDYGDADLRSAIEEARRKGLRVPLAVFGHMHKQLQKCRGERVMVKTERDGTMGRETVMVNAAVVPRHGMRRVPRASLHHFQVVELARGGVVGSVEEVWTTAGGEIVKRDNLLEVGSEFVNI